MFDRFRIEQVITNLLMNAMKYGGGRLIEIELQERGGRASLSVRDHGMGIAPENHARVFHRFERAVTANEASGLGLGLYIVRQIAESHGGTICLDSAVGEGAKFTLTLPLA